jgi:hypothetical protein
MQRRLLAWLGPACLLAACAPEMAATVDTMPPAEPVRISDPEPRIIPIPEIPVALRGCWDWSPPEDPEEPGSPHRLVITATTITETGSGQHQMVATAEYVSRVTPTSIEGLFSAPDGDSRATIATALMLGDGGDNGPVDQLRRAEGDAGSSFYDRCPS